MSEDVQELMKRLKEVDEMLHEARERLSKLTIMKQGIIKSLNVAVHGADVGSIVTIEQDLGKLRAGEELRVTEVDDRHFWPHHPPRLHVQHKTKSGEWCKQPIALYSSWKLVALDNTQQASQD